MAASADQAFLDQINAHVGIAHKVCRLYFDDPDDRADALQEMMYQLWRSYATFGERSKFSTWMYSVCLNTAITYIRKDKHKKREPLQVDHHEIADPVHDNQEEEMTLLFNAIASLQPLNKAIIMLYLDDLSYEEIAAITGLSKSNVSVRLVRIKKELEQRVKKSTKSTEDVNS